MSTFPSPASPTSLSWLEASSLDSPDMQIKDLAQVWPGYSRDKLLRSGSTSANSLWRLRQDCDSDHFDTGSKNAAPPTKSSPPQIPMRAQGHYLYTPKQKLRKRKSPRIFSLRELRAKDSEAQLKSLYETQTLAYLNDAIEPHGSRHGASPTKWSFSESSSDENIKEEPEEDEQHTTM